MSLRDLPGIDRLLDEVGRTDLPRELVRAAAREVVDEARAAVRGGAAVPTDIAARVGQRLVSWLSMRQRPVINATGIVVHTNLGRAPWHPDAARAVHEVAFGYTNIEMDLATGKQGPRHPGVLDKLCRLTGAEAGVVVNNCAAAVLLALTALARDREVIVSRGQLVEIGGSFRVPDVISSGGARLVEVGTTNRTRPSDVEAAITESTAMVLTIHPSNFRLTGFVRELTPEEVVPVAHAHDLLVMADLGSGSLGARGGETAVRDVLAAGVDVVAFSGDKLLGGPQAGILLGRAEPLRRIRKHPLYRALRIGKATAVALEATLAAHLRGDALPVDAMVGMPVEALHARATAFVATLAEAGVVGHVVSTEGFAGGGAMPMRALPSHAVAVRTGSAAKAARALRTGEPAVVVRVHDDQLLLDLRTVTEPQLQPLCARLAAVVGER